MKYCTKCGNELVDNAAICVKCGTKPRNTPTEKDEKSFGYAFIGFILPLAGLILYLLWKDDMPLRAKSCGKGALIGVITSVVLCIILFGFYFALFGFLIINA